MKKESALKNFFKPKTIAVIGASNNAKKVGNVLMQKLLNYQGKVIPINLKQNQILSKKSYESVLKYKQKIDLAIIAIPAKFVKKVVQQCAKKKIKNIIIISAGFSETGNTRLEKQIVKIAQKNKIKILGPNCFGIANPYLNLDTTFSNTPPKKGNTAFISQSGALFSYLSDFKKIGFSGFVSLGNQAILSFEDFIEYFSQDKETKKIILYMEKIKNGKKFIEICRKTKKEIIVVKAGKTKKGSENAISHTGSLATEFKIYRGIFEQAKIKQANSLAQAFALKKQTIKIPSKIKEINIITNAGGAGILITDELERKSIKTSMKDLLGTAQAKDYKKALKKIKNPLVVLTPQKMSEPEKTAEILSKNSIACFLGEKSIKKAIQILKNKKIKYYTKCI